MISDIEKPFRKAESSSTADVYSVARQAPKPYFETTSAAEATENEKNVPKSVDRSV